MISHLHTHSCYSFLEGLSFPEDLVKQAAKYGMPALALTDHISMTGQVLFYTACQEAAIKPIFGLEIDLQLPYSLISRPSQVKTGQIVLLSRNIEGWHNICRLSSFIHLNSENNSNRGCSLDELAMYSSGLICLTGGYKGIIHPMINRGESEELMNFISMFRELFQDNLFVELNRNPSSKMDWENSLIEIASNFNLPLVATNPIYYIDPSQSILQKTASSIRMNTPIENLPDNEAAPAGSYFMSPKELQSKFKDLPYSLNSVDDIVSICNVEIPLGKPNYPKLEFPEGLSAITILRQKAELGAKNLYGELSTEIKNRLEYELSTIEKSGYEPIFLIAEEMISYAQEKGIPYASRGSASSSLVAHCIGITTPDPIQLDLYFERFLNPARTTPPDIDTDFCSRRREDVINHLFEKYGESQVAMVGTVFTYRPRSALNDVAKAHGLKPDEIKTLSNRLPYRFWYQAAQKSEINGGNKHPYSDLINEFAGKKKYLTIFEQAAEFIGLPNHLSIHPGGVVIAPGPITEFVPIARSGGKGITITQFDLDDVERIGLVKLDLLGIRGLSVLGDLVETIYSWRRSEFKKPLGVLDSIPEEDEKTASLVSAGLTIGCFQIESPGMRATLKEIQAKNPDDLMAALALYRPGPLKGGLRDAFIRRHKGLEQVEHIHPSLSGLLRETHGVILYQEQVLRIAHELAGLSLAESDLLRRAMSHFDPGKQMKLLEEKFILGAEKHSLIPHETGSHIWEMMAAFAGYGFPKAHAASYAQVAWHSAWCKAHYTPEFMASVLANWGGYYPQSVYLNEARRLKLKLMPPHVNYSKSQFTVVYPHGEPVLYMGLDQLHDLTKRTQDRILQFRPFHTLSEFINRVDPRKREVENLIKVGGFEGLAPIPALLHEYMNGKANPGQLSLFDDLSTSSGDDWSLDQKIAAQKNLLGVSLSYHPLTEYTLQIIGTGAISTTDAILKLGEIVRIAGIRQTIFRSFTSQGKWMANFTLEDFDGMIDVVLVPEIYQRTKNLISDSSIPYIVEGTIEPDPDTGEPFMQAKRLWKLTLLT